LQDHGSPFLVELHGEVKSPISKYMKERNSYIEEPSGENNEGGYGIGLIYKILDKNGFYSKPKREFW
jgi:hypothetical protein